VERYHGRLITSKTRFDSWGRNHERKTAASSFSFIGVGGGDRTHDPRLMSPVLYQLSYPDIYNSDVKRTIPLFNIGAKAEFSYCHRSLTSPIICPSIGKGGTSISSFTEVVLQLTSVTRGRVRNKCRGNKRSGKAATFGVLALLTAQQDLLPDVSLDPTEAGSLKDLFDEGEGLTQESADVAGSSVLSDLSPFTRLLLADLLAQNDPDAKLRRRFRVRPALGFLVQSELDEQGEKVLTFTDGLEQAHHQRGCTLGGVDHLTGVFAEEVVS
jgi:hypothetical protein